MLNRRLEFARELARPLSRDEVALVEGGRFDVGEALGLEEEIVARVGRRDLLVGCLLKTIEALREVLEDVERRA